MKILRQTLSIVLSWALVLATVPLSVAQEQAPPPQDQNAPQYQGPPPQDQGPPPDQQDNYPQNGEQSAEAPPPPAPRSPADLDQMVAPIALYPDELVAQILAASTYPDQVVEADRFVSEHPELKGKALGDAVDQQPWDESVKALTAFPSVLANMDKNLSWTSSLGEAYVNQQQDVMNAVQQMRRRAQNAGNLRSNEQERVQENDGNIDIEPANPQVVYVPEYDPWLVYGAGLAPWPGWYWYPGLYFAGPGIGFGLGFGIGWFGGFGWGWGHWGFDWRNHYVRFGGRPYYSHSAVIFNHNNFYRGRVGYAGRGYAGGRAPARGFVAPRGGVEGRGYAGGHAFTGGHTYAQPHNNGTRSGAFSGYGRNGSARSFSSRGRSSFGGGGSRGGGGGHVGGGSHGGGHR